MTAASVHDTLCVPPVMGLPPPGAPLLRSECPGCWKCPPLIRKPPPLPRWTLPRICQEEVVVCGSELSSLEDQAALPLPVSRLYL